MLITPATSAFSKPKGFLVIEGVNGAGKSTLIRAIVALARERGTAVSIIFNYENCFF